MIDIILGVGIPIAYIVVGLFMSRAAYRSRVRRDLTQANSFDMGMNKIDTGFICSLMFLLWPLMALPYFLCTGIMGTNGATLATLFRTFMDHNLPESNREKERRQRDKKDTMQARIRQLERELRIGEDDGARKRFEWYEDAEGITRRRPDRR